MPHKRPNAITRAAEPSTDTSVALTPDAAPGNSGVPVGVDVLLLAGGGATGRTVEETITGAGIEESSGMDGAVVDKLALAGVDTEVKVDEAAVT